MSSSSNSKKRGRPEGESEVRENPNNKKGRFNGESKKIHTSAVTSNSESKTIHNSVGTSHTVKIMPRTPPKDKENGAGQGKPESRLIPRRLFATTTKEKIDGLKRELQPLLLKQLEELSEILEIDPTYEVDLEMAAESMNLLKHLRSLNPDLGALGEKAGEGAKMLLEGVKLVTRGRDLLQAARADIPTSTV